jgi:hypothetical protein
MFLTDAFDVFVLSLLRFDDLFQLSLSVLRVFFQVHFDLSFKIVSITDTFSSNSSVFLLDAVATS